MLVVVVIFLSLFYLFIVYLRVALSEDVKEELEGRMDATPRLYYQLNKNMDKQPRTINTKITMHNVDIWVSVRTFTKEQR